MSIYTWLLRTVAIGGVAYAWYEVAGFWVAVAMMGVIVTLWLCADFLDDHADLLNHQEGDPQ